MSCGAGIEDMFRDVLQNKFSNERQFLLRFWSKELNLPDKYSELLAKSSATQLAEYFGLIINTRHVWIHCISQIPKLANWDDNFLNIKKLILQKR